MFMLKSTQAACRGLRQLQTSAVQAALAAEAGSRHKVTMIPGDGIGPELMSSVKDVFSVAGVPVDFEEVFASEIAPGQSASAKTVASSIKRNGTCLKGIIASPAHWEGGILETLNMRIRKELDLFANVVCVKSLPGLKTRHDNLDFVIIREQREGEYSALEHSPVPGVVESLKIITREKSTRIAKFAFDYAEKHGRSKVTAVHKANIMKLADGLFLESCRQVSELYPKIEFEHMIIDNCCMQLVSNPHQFDVMVMPNLYGNIIDNLAAGLVGGPGVVPGESHSASTVVFEPGARHAGSSIMGRDQSNPTAILLCAANMLSHLALHEHATVIRDSVREVVSRGKTRTPDMGGHSTRTDITMAIIKEVQQRQK